jgi:hypothetical protein
MDVKASAEQISYIQKKKILVVQSKICDTILLIIPGQSPTNLKTEAACSSETSMPTHEPTQDQNPDLHLDNACHVIRNHTLAEYGYKSPSCVRRT